MEDYFLIYDNMPLIRLSDKNYPMYMPQVRASTQQTSFPIPIRDYILEPFGYMPVFDSEKPEGDVVTEAQPKLGDDGKWYKSWDVRPFNEEEIAQNLYNKKQTLIQEVYQLISVDYYSGALHGSEDSGIIVDISMQNFPLIEAMKHLSSDLDETETLEYKTLDQKFVDLTKSQILEVYNLVCRQTYAIQKNSYSYLKQIEEAETLSDLPTLPDTFREGTENA